MKQWLFLVGASVLLASCSSRPLTEAECQAIGDKEIQYAVARVSPDEAEVMREHLRKSADDGVAHCVAGKTYRRSDFKCMMKANEPDAIGKCISEVSKRMGH
jgi:small lipoprotein (TIGR04454 family)